MAEVKLQAAMRERIGKGASRQTRLQGRVPATLYGHGMAPLSIEVDRRDLVTAFHTDAGMNVLLDITVNGDTTLAIARDLQRDPVKGTLLHADFVKVDRKQRIEVDVPVHLIGEAPGAKEGGVLEHPLFSLHVRCTVTDVPDSIDADVSSLQIGDALRVTDLRIRGDFEILNDSDEVVASVAAPISEEELAAMEAEAGVEQEEAEVEAEVPEGAEAEEAAVAEGDEGASGEQESEESQ